MLPLTEESFRVSVSVTGSFREWRRTDDLQKHGPDDDVSAVDLQKGVVIFGNGINGRRPPSQAALRVEYRVSAGARGNLPRGIRWTVAGVAAPFGVNSEPTAGGADAWDLTQLRSAARRSVRMDHPLVTTGDLEDAALSLTDLGVRRVKEFAPDPRGRVPGTRLLVAIGPAGSEAEALQPDEPARWRDRVRRRLGPRVPLGQRLEVVAPRYVPVRVTARLVAAPRTDPDRVRADAERLLRANLAIVGEADRSGWPFGRDVSLLSITGWLRNVAGVVRVADARLLAGDAGEPVTSVALGATGLPLLRLAPGDIIVDRPPIGGRP